uniref:Uncharacterized protein n=1 Tax=Arundo donax TaxID=35708 RepID=A0A0A8Z0Z1_ARUDO
MSSSRFLICQMHPVRSWPSVTWLAKALCRVESAINGAVDEGRVSMVTNAEGESSRTGLHLDGE